MACPESLPFSVGSDEDQEVGHGGKKQTIRLEAPDLPGALSSQRGPAAPQGLQITGHGGRRQNLTSSPWSPCQITLVEISKKIVFPRKRDIVQNMEMDLKWYFYNKAKVSDAYSPSRDEMRPLLGNTHTVYKLEWTSTRINAKLQTLLRMLSLGSGTMGDTDLLHACL